MSWLLIIGGLLLLLTGLALLVMCWLFYLARVQIKALQDIQGNHLATIFELQKQLKKPSNNY